MLRESLSQPTQKILMKSLSMTSPHYLLYQKRSIFSVSNRAIFFAYYILYCGKCGNSPLRTLFVNLFDYYQEDYNLIVLYYSALYVWSNVKCRKVKSCQTKGDNNVKKVYLICFHSNSEFRYTGKSCQNAFRLFPIHITCMLWEQWCRIE